MKEKIKLLQDQATTNLRVKQLYDQAGMTWDMHWEKLAEQAEGKGISVVPYIVTGSGLNLMPEFNKYEFARLIVKECIEGIKEWRDASDEHMDKEEYWKGYRSGCNDAIVEIIQRFGVE